MSGNSVKATEFWQNLPCYQGLSCPSWSEGQLTGFKARHNIKQRNQHGEAGSADLGQATQEMMQEIREAGQQYDADDTYNKDGTGMFWKMIPDRSLATERASGQKAG